MNTRSLNDDADTETVTADPQARAATRVATSADLGPLLELENESFAADRLSRRGYRRLLCRPSATILIAELHAKIAGSAVLLFNRATCVARLYSLAVRPAYRGHGIARALLRAVEAQAVERNCAGLRLEVREDNVAARALYETEGFVAIERLPHFYADRIDALRLELSLWQAGLSA
jgi:[ribosomal protein S18]-alanine N-acetyltransferase